MLKRYFTLDQFATILKHAAIGESAYSLLIKFGGKKGLTGNDSMSCLNGQMRLVGANVDLIGLRSLCL